MKKLLSVLMLTVLTGCAMQPWTEADHTLFANRYCGGRQNYDAHWGECKGMQGSMVGKTAIPVMVYGVKSSDADAATMNADGVIFNRE